MANEIYNTTWWGNAIDTAITAGTEPDFFGSQMKMLTGQPELVTNGDFATDSDWIKQSNWTISGGKANSNGGSGYIKQNSVVTNNKSYKISFTTTVVSGQFRAVTTADGSTYTPYITSSGSYVFTINPTTSIAGGFEFISSNFIGSIDNVSVKLVRAEEVEAVKCLADWIHTTALQDLNN